MPPCAKMRLQHTQFAVVFIASLGALTIVHHAGLANKPSQPQGGASTFVRRPVQVQTPTFRAFTSACDGSDALGKLRRSLSGGSANRGMAEVVVLQSNATMTLTDWVQYHARLFGLQQLHVIDDNSGPHMRIILRGFQALGLNVWNASALVPGYSYASSKALAVSTVLRKIKAARAPKFVFALDVDEFLAYSPRSGRTESIPRVCSSESDQIFQHLQELDRDTRFKYKMRSVEQCGPICDTTTQVAHRRALSLLFSNSTFSHCPPLPAPCGDFEKTFWVCRGVGVGGGDRRLLAC